MHKDTRKYTHQSVLGLLVDEVVERLQGTLQALLTNLQSILRHVVFANLD
jgi:hypothetical protein